MKFFKTHFTKHSFIRTPHKWILALMLSPIHALEMRYKRQYHLKFAHAKKLFAIDMTLLFASLLLMCTTLFWWLYDPTVTALVDLSIQASVSTERLTSGDLVSLDISYTNNSDRRLTAARLVVTLPPGFMLSSKTQTAERENGSIVFPLADIAPGDTASHILKGTYYGTVGAHEPVQAMLIYTQEGRHTPESDVQRLYVSARESSITVSVDGPTQYLLNTAIPVTISIENNHDHTLPDLSLDMSGNGQFVWERATTTHGMLATTSSTWQISKLAPHASASLHGMMRIVAPPQTTDVSWPFTTVLTIDDQMIQESTRTFPLTIATPNVRATASWSTEHSTVGASELLTLSITNTGNVLLQNPALLVGVRSVPLSVPTIDPGVTVPFSLPMSVISDHVSNGPLGPIFLPTMLFTAGIPDSESYTFSQSIDTPPLPIGTTISMRQSSRYYTAEGDQLGRGPLPPQVGKKTTYWVFTQIQNTLGMAQDISFSTTIAPNAQWTGKSSVSKGGDITYDPSSHTAAWQARSLSPYEIVGIYFELAITPTEQDRGSIPILTSASQLTAKDPYIDTTISQSVGSIYASLDTDSIGTQKGISVE